MKKQYAEIFSERYPHLEFFEQASDKGYVLEDGFRVYIEPSIYKLLSLDIEQWKRVEEKRLVFIEALRENSTRDKTDDFRVRRHYYTKDGVEKIAKWRVVIAAHKHYLNREKYWRKYGTAARKAWESLQPYEARPLQADELKELELYSAYWRVPKPF